MIKGFSVPVERLRGKGQNRGYEWCERTLNLSARENFSLTRVSPRTRDNDRNRVSRTRGVLRFGSLFFQIDTDDATVRRAYPRSAIDDIARVNDAYVLARAYNTSPSHSRPRSRRSRVSRGDSRRTSGGVRSPNPVRRLSSCAPFHRRTERRSLPAIDD